METPTIAEKVKFWEEQDRINKELIPRVLKTHELLTAHIENHEAASTQIASLDALHYETVKQLTTLTRRAIAIAVASMVVAVVSILVTFAV